MALGSALPRWPGTREICAKLYAAIVQLRPGWDADELDHGRIKVVYSGTASDVPPVSAHVVGCWLHLPGPASGWVAAEQDHCVSRMPACLGAWYKWLVGSNSTFRVLGRPGSKT